MIAQTILTIISILVAVLFLIVLMRLFDYRRAVKHYETLCGELYEENEKLHQQMRIYANDENERHRKAHSHDFD